MSNTEAPEPHSAILWVLSQVEALEKNQIHRILDEWTDSIQLGRWCKSIHGVGPVITAGLLAHLDITKAHTASHFHSFAGLNPDRKWIGRETAAKVVNEALQSNGGSLPDAAIALSTFSGVNVKTILRFAMTDRDGNPIEMTKTSLIAAGARRPWSAELKSLCWNIGQSFVYSSASPKSFYGPHYIQRKQWEIERNDAGKNADYAAEQLRVKRYGKTTAAYKAYVEGRLPDAQITARAMRWTVKLFLSHYHHQAYKLHYGKDPVRPYAIEHLGHADFIAPPEMVV